MSLFTKTVDTITSDLRKMVASLEAHVEAEVAKEEKAIASALAAKEQHLKASAIAKKIKELLS